MRRFKLILFISLLVLATSFLSIDIHINSMKSAYGLSGWSGYYFVEIDNSKPGSTALTDYQIKIVIDSSHTDFWDKVQPDAKDVRFTEEDGETLLPYWIEKWDYDNKNATIWVKVPNIPVGIKYIYMWYGNSSATGNGWHTNPNNPSTGWYAGDGDNTFIFFDDFEGVNINSEKWRERFYGWAEVGVGNGKLRVLILLRHFSFAGIESKQAIDEIDIVWETRYEIPSAHYGDARIRLRLEDVNLHGDYGIFGSNSCEYFWKGNTGVKPTLDKWMKSIQTLYSNGSKFKWETFKEDGTPELTSDIANSSVTSGSNKKIYLRCGDDTMYGDYDGKMYVDYVFVRKYASKEPKISILTSLIQGTDRREGYFEFFVDRENKTWLLRIPDKGYTTGWMPFNRLRDTGSFMSGHYADRRYHLLFDLYPSGRCHLIFNDRREGISIKFAGR